MQTCRRLRDFVQLRQVWLNLHNKVELHWLVCEHLCSDTSSLSVRDLKNLVVQAARCHCISTPTWGPTFIRRFFHKLKAIFEGCWTVMVFLAVAGAYEYDSYFELSLQRSLMWGR